MYSGTKSEADLVEWQNTLLGIIRNVDDSNDRLVLTYDLGESWNVFDELPFSNLGGPGIILVGNQLIFGGRNGSGKDAITSLFVYDLIDKKIINSIDLPGKYDNGYPNFIVNYDKVIVAYYATEDNITRINFAFLNIE